MSRAAFAAELALHGPAAVGQIASVGTPGTASAAVRTGFAGPLSAAPSLAACQAYCRRLARAHYENFAVASWLLPRTLRTHFYNIYAYCRWSDDLADETGGHALSTGDLLDWWEAELRACHAGQARHPVFIALRETIREFAIPPEPFHDLLSAFRQDQQVSRYETFDDLLDYCRRSANPVGRLVLYLGRAHDEERGKLSDAICTGLQLANFCQDVAEDWRRGRVYIPLEECRRFDYSEADFAAGRDDRRFKDLLSLQVDRAESWLRSGLPLVERLPRALAGDIWLIAHGGLRILERIRAVEFDVWRRRPKVTRRDQFRLLAGYLARRWFGSQRVPEFVA
jgi:squalene synthase HpnC